MDVFLGCEISDNIGKPIDWSNPSLDSNKFS
jgi:hypothetical protein